VEFEWWNWELNKSLVFLTFGAIPGDYMILNWSLARQNNMPCNKLNVNLRRKEEELADTKKKFKQLGGLVIE
jgi:hypothetical protein